MWHWGVKGSVYLWEFKTYVVRSLGPEVMLFSPKLSPSVPLPSVEALPPIPPPALQAPAPAARRPSQVHFADDVLRGFRTGRSVP